MINLITYLLIKQTLTALLLQQFIATSNFSGIDYKRYICDTMS
ncbi:Uncharacterised protein [Yersinia pekkanenii]|uniref:Uncharacterized protein n=1 Tax=Yersinia pekkanenii TaxID=1288385 RepID=A0A0T9PUN5_9GAMM|nr:Uncharacterised protein [Yersinia pekkanenii]CRY63237.1 Uncharacterised protein [Yersinia pekkanenii]